MYKKAFFTLFSLASILNIDKQTLADALKQVFGDLFKQALPNKYKIYANLARC